MNRFMKKTVSVLMAAAMAFACAACGQSGTETTAAAGGTETTAAGAIETTAAEAPEANTAKSEETLKVALSAEPNGLFPLSASVSESGLVVQNAIGGRLLEFNAETGEVSPSLADTYELVDETHMKFHLREDACYSDGTPVTAEDVLYSFTLAKENAVSFANYLDMENSSAEDDHTVIIAMTQYVPGWEQQFCNPAAIITSEANVEAAGGLDAASRDVPVGCGRYVFKEWVSGQYITLERNENYWDKDYNGYYKTIQFTFVPDAASRVLALQSGDVNVAQRITMSDYMALQNDPNVKGVPFATDRIFNLFFNVSEGSVFSDPLLREAAAYAIDANAVNALQNMGQGQIVQGQWASTHPYYREYYEGGHLNQDINKAKELMAQAGYPDGFDCTLITQAANQQMATVVQESLRQVGINVNIEMMEQSTYVSAARNGEYDCYVGATTAGTLSPDNFNQLDPDKIGVTVGGYRDDSEAASAMIAKASSYDEAEAKEGWDELYDLVLGQYYCVGLCNAIDCYGLSKNLDGLKLGKLNYMDVSYVHPVE